ncbi:MAG: hypothetical protein IJ532_00080 [Alphaproteobacteria bacterium]|nr:hypothetical protein [Alphaproteobacteria bacterium]
MAAKQQTTQYDYIEDVKANVLQKFPLLGVTMSKLDTKPTDGELSQIIDTAATDGKTVFFNPEYFKSLNEDQRAFIYAHEVMHVAFNHIMRSKGKQPKLWNTATDAVINQILKKEGYEIVGDGVNMPEALNHSAEEIYDKLLERQKNKNNQDSNSNQQSEKNTQDNQASQNKEQDGQSKGDDNKNNKQKQSSQKDETSVNNNEEQDSQQKTGDGKSDELNNQDIQNNQSDTDSSAKQQQNKNRSSSAPNQQREPLSQDIEGDLTDDESSLQHGHGLWQKTVEDSEKEEAKTKQSVFERIKGIFKPESKQKDKEDTENESQNSEEDFLVRNRRMRHKQQQDVKQKISEYKKEVIDAIGRIDTNVPVEHKLGESRQVADWKRILKQNIREPEDKWSYRRSDADNDYMARSEELEDETKAKTEVMIDVSGSVDEELVKEFLRQLKPLLKRSDIMVGCFDNEFYPFKEIKNKKDIDNFRIPGGGGTNLDLAVRSFSDSKDTNKIIFTDGVGSMPRPDLKNVKNLFWVVYQNEMSSWYYDNGNHQGDWFKPICGKVIYVKRQEIEQNFVIEKSKYIGR